MKDPRETREEPPARGLDRRDFLKISGAAYFVAAVGCDRKAEHEEAFRPPPPPPTEEIDPATLELPASQGYLLVDTSKCQGCLTCMLACSLAHEGRENLSFARIQVIQDPFERFPADVTLEACRQCIDPACVKACPVEALYVDEKHGNVRTVDKEACEGCFRCVEACPFLPSRALWNFEEQRAMKCDLCADTPYWSEQGGAGGKQLCVEVCPVGAIRLSRKIPLQKGDRGYKVNLRGEAWAKMGYAVD